MSLSAADAYAQGLAERDEAVAEWDFVLRFLQDIGIALGKGRLIRLHRPVTA
jgi:hypothetical protein